MYNFESMTKQHVVIDLVSSSDDDENDNAIFVCVNQHPCASASAKRSSEEVSVPSSKRIKRPGDSRDHECAISDSAESARSSGGGSDALKGSHFKDEIDIYRQDGDNGILSKGIVVSVSGIKPMKNESKKQDRRETLHCTIPLSHIQQRDKWSCGFRNFQMILCASLPYLAPIHPLRDHLKKSELISDISTSAYATASSKRIISAPSVLQIQAFMEMSWKHGFDVTGKKHFHGRIYKKKSKIGALEVSSVSSFLSLDTTVVQFIVCHASRSMLGKFLWGYFERINNMLGNKHRRESSGGIVGQVMSSIENRKQEVEVVKFCSSVVLPVYLQWEGHSVTVVGIERCISADDMDSGIYDLLTFDPMKKCVPTKLSDGSCQTTTFYSKLSTKVTMKKDCQLVVFGTNSLSESEKLNRRVEGSVVTAANEEVQKAIL